MGLFGPSTRQKSNTLNARLRRAEAKLNKKKRKEAKLRDTAKKKARIAAINKQCRRY